MIWLRLNYFWEMLMEHRSVAPHASSFAYMFPATHLSGLASGCRTKKQSRHAKLGWNVWRAALAETTSAAIRAWPLAALGVSRLLVIKGLGYQEHVSEYGVHWNFFATLFFMRLVVVPVNRLCPLRIRPCLTLAAVGVYQWFLVKGGLSDFIVYAPRDTLFAMNREGVLGLVGFVAIYYIAEELGCQIQAQHQKLDKVSPIHFCAQSFPCSPTRPTITSCFGWS